MLREVLYAFDSADYMIEVIFSKNKEVITKFRIDANIVKI